MLVIGLLDRQQHCHPLCVVVCSRETTESFVQALEALEGAVLLVRQHPPTHTHTHTHTRTRLLFTISRAPSTPPLIRVLRLRLHGSVGNRSFMQSQLSSPTTARRSGVPSCAYCLWLCSSSASYTRYHVVTDSCSCVLTSTGAGPSQRARGVRAIRTCGGQASVCPGYVHPCGNSVRASGATCGATAAATICGARPFSRGMATQLVHTGSWVDCGFVSSGRAEPQQRSRGDE